MALTIHLRDRIGEGMRQINLPTETVVFPEVVVLGEDTYVLRRVERDKRSAEYFKARVHKIEGSS